jgi:hypothetical protein
MMQQPMSYPMMSAPSMIAMPSYPMGYGTTTGTPTAAAHKTATAAAHKTTAAKAKVAKKPKKKGGCCH